MAMGLTAEPVPRSANSHAVAKVTIKGTVNDPRGGRAPIDQLINALRKDGPGYYTTAPLTMMSTEIAYAITFM